MTEYKAGTENPMDTEKSVDTESPMDMEKSVDTESLMDTEIELHTNPIIDTDDLIKYLRAEIFFWDLVKDQNGKEISHWEFDGTLSRPYQMTFDDLHAAIENARKNSYTVDQFVFGWFEPLYNRIGDMVGMPALVGFPELETMDEVWDAVGAESFFPKNKTQLAFAILEDMDSLANEVYACLDEESILPGILDDYLERIENLSWNAAQGLEKWRFTDREARRFISFHRYDEQLREMGAAKRAVYRKYLEKFCAENDLTALKIRGYACYGTGNPLYECDWYTSRDCMLKLIELGDDALKAQAANTLGYIYYYGRCNGMIPEYELAYKYFSYAGYYGYWESNYKIGDMLARGYGIMKNEKAAYFQYLKVYKECYELFQIGNKNHTFSDAALRMGRVFFEGIGQKPSLMSSYYYYLQAKKAIDTRMRETNFYGIQTVKENIENGLAQVRSELLASGQNILEREYNLSIQRYLEILLHRKHTVKLIVEETDSGYRFTFQRQPLGKFDPAKRVMITVERCSFCEVTDHVAFESPKDIDLNLRNGKAEILFDRIDEKNDYIRLFHGKKRECKFKDVGMMLVY